jgi:hypothetical protein
MSSHLFPSEAKKGGGLNRPVLESLEQNARPDGKDFASRQASVGVPDKFSHLVSD